uniref:NADH-ubiquinone oxidoreductase chain 4L n=1 Tax=Mongoloraphidia harmandi TaxID=633873 RepID=C8YXC6_9NEOP|nr:NADH dehydrogenase subunit 4L [Mongoloraphidia harmandi]ACO92560.1 NADH dehydrogenase subunit 4L [Mongoloraphidia harmandi]
MYLYFIFMFYFSGLLIFCLSGKHFLMMLLSLEFLVLGLFLMVFYFLKSFGFELYFSMIFIIFCVCEGALGLSILVSLIRTHGNDYFKSFNFLQC